MVKSAGPKSSANRKAVSKSTTLATAQMWKPPKQDVQFCMQPPAPPLIAYQYSGPPTEAARDSSNNSSAKQGSAEVLFAAIPMGLREKYVPNPSNPNLNYYGRLMIPFYPMGNSKMNGNGLSMNYCLAQQGLMQPQDPVFSEEVKAGKEFIFFQLAWPGYYPRINWNMKISLFGPSGSELTRGGLAWTIANQYRLLYEECCAHPPLQSSSPDAAWRLGPNGFSFDYIRLAGFWTSGGDLWHASVMVLTPVDLKDWAKAGTTRQTPQILLPSSADSGSMDFSDSSSESDAEMNDLQP